MKLPYVAALVAALLADGYDPTAIESAVIAELQRQTAGRWRRAHGGHGWGGDWYPLEPATATAQPKAPVREPVQGEGAQGVLL